MKIIGQYEIDEIEKVFNEIHDLKNYKVDSELYGHFLFDIYEKDFTLKILILNLLMSMLLWILKMTTMK